MVRIMCPICAGPLELRAHPIAPAGTSPSPALSSADAVSDDVARVLASALRALEDQASGARWRLTQADPPPLVQAQLEQSLHEIDLLRELLTQRGIPRPRTADPTRPHPEPPGQRLGRPRTHRLHPSSVWTRAWRMLRC